MPNFEALYYPYFEPPNEWLRSFLLFYDSIKTIVPSEVKYVPSAEVSSILDIYPNAVKQISPSEKDNKIDKINLKLLEDAFQIIAEKKHKKNSLIKNTCKLIINKKGGIGIEGYTLLHESKISVEVRALLEEFHLLQPKVSDVSRKIDTNMRDFSVVDEEAGNLIVSYISDKIASRYGLPSVTETELNFAVNSIRAICPTGSMMGIKAFLAKAIISLEIP